MADLTPLFANTAQGDQLDADNMSAGNVLQKLAQDEGLDLKNLGEEKVAELLSEFETPPGQQKHEDSPMANEQLTHADVAAELVKVAQNEGVDINALSREQYTEAYEKLAADMQTPEYAENQVKIAEAHELGQHIAAGFLEGIKEANAVTDALGKGWSAAKGGASAAKGKLKNLGSAAKGKLDSAADAVGTAALSRSNMPGKVMREKGIDAAQARVRNVGRGIMGAGAVGAVGAGAAGAHHMSKKAQDEAIEAEALKVAQEFLIERGIDPDIGEKLASMTDVVENRAIEILTEAGWLA